MAQVQGQDLLGRFKGPKDRVGAITRWASNTPVRLWFLEGSPERALSMGGTPCSLGFRKIVLAALI